MTLDYGPGMIEAADAEGGPSRDDDGAQPLADLVPGLGAQEIDRELRLADRETDVGNRRLAFYLADMDARGISQLLGFPTATAYAVKRLEMGRRHAQELIAAGRALEELPKTDEAFCDGRLNWSRVRLLTKIAVPETEAAWVERAVALSWAQFKREVLTSEKGRPPREGRKGLPQVKIGVAARLDRLDYEKWELAKRKLADELGELVTDADLMRAAAELLLGTRQDGTVKGRERVDDSLYRIVVDRCSDCQGTYLQTLEGPAELPKPTLEAIRCDAKLEVIRDEEPRKKGEPAKPGAGRRHAHSDPTPAWMRKQVLIRDHYACKVCGGSRNVEAHHVDFVRSWGRRSRRTSRRCCSRCHDAHPRQPDLRPGRGAPRARDHRPGWRAAREVAQQIGRRIRKMRGDAKFAEVSSCGGTLPSVTFASLPASEDAGWLARHAHLFKWNDMRGEHVFEAGNPVESIADDSGSPRLALDQGGQPIRLETLIGQERVVRSIGIAIEASRIRGRQLDHVLLLGEAGLGKSTLAKAIGNELGTRVATTSGPLIKDASVLIRILCSLACGQVLFIDEIHGLPRPVMECLYEAMEDGVLRLPVTDGHRSKTIEFRLNPFTLIGATTELGKIPGPFLSRFTVREHLESLSLGDLAQIAKRAIARTPLEIDLETATEVAKLAHGIPREAIKLSKRIADLAVAKRVGRIDAAFLAEALRTYGIDERGLDPIAQKALAALERNGRGRAMGLSRWAAASGLCPAVLRQSEVELLRLGLVAVTSRGRMAIGPDYS